MALSDVLKIGYSNGKYYLKLSGTQNTGIDFTGAMTNSIKFSNTNSGDIISFSGITWVPNSDGSAGNCLIRAGTYVSPITNSSTYQSGMIRLYGQTSGTGTSYDRAIFACLKTTGTKNVIPIAGLVEILASTGSGVTNCKACEFIVDLHSTSSLAAATATLHAGWFKITAIDGATITSGAIASPLWVDNQLYGANIAPVTEYGLYCTTGGSKPKAFLGFNTTSSGYSNFIHFDSTYASNYMLTSGDIDGGTASYYLKVSINGTAYGIQIYTI